MKTCTRQKLTGAHGRVTANSLRSIVFDSLARCSDYTLVSGPDRGWMFARVTDAILRTACGLDSRMLASIRVDYATDNCGMLNWRGETPTLRDATVGTSYLTAMELRLYELVLSNIIAMDAWVDMLGYPVSINEWFAQLERALVVWQIAESPMAPSPSRKTVDQRVRRHWGRYQNRIALQAPMAVQ